MEIMNNEEIRLRALLSIRYNDDRYTKAVPEWQQFAGLYPEIIGQDDIVALEELKTRLDAEFLEEDKLKL